MTYEILNCPRFERVYVLSSVFTQEISYIIAVAIGPIVAWLQYSVVVKTLNLQSSNLDSIPMASTANQAVYPRERQLLAALWGGAARIKQPSQSWLTEKWWP